MAEGLVGFSVRESGLKTKWFLVAPIEPRIVVSSKFFELENARV